MVQLKDVLHLYLGCEVKVKNHPVAKLVTVGVRNNEIVIVRWDNDEWSYADVAEVKPILRPLSSMIEMEAFNIFKMYWGKDKAEDWSGDTGSAYFNPKKVRPVVSHAMRIINGDDYETGDFMKVVSIVPYLLKQHFDLFGLIESGQAIDATTIPPSKK